MSRRNVLGLVLIASIAVGGWAWAQQDRTGTKLPVAGESGPYAISASGTTALLLDTKSGKTWMLTRSYNGDPVWLPAKRFDLDQEAKDWQQRDEAIKEHLAEQEKAKKK